MSVAVVVLTAMIGACGMPGPEETSPAAEAPAAPTATERVAFYQDCWNLFNTKAWDQFAACYTADAESENVDSGMPVARGTDAVVQGAKDIVGAFPDINGSLQLVVVGEREIAALGLLTGTHTGPLTGGPEPLPATNKPIGLMMGHVVIGDATSPAFAREVIYNENGTMMAQLGLSPAPARPVMTSGVATPVVAIASGSETEAANVDAMRAQFDRFNAHDVQGLLSYNADSMVFHGLTDPKDTTGADAAAMMEGYFAAFPDVKLTIDSIWGAGDFVAARGTFEGTNTGAAPAMGIAAPTGKPVKIHFLEFMRMENGKVVEDWLIYDGMAFAMQLGMMGS
jgi:predicted ester cyclase